MQALGDLRNLVLREGSTQAASAQGRADGADRAAKGEEAGDELSKEGSRGLTEDSLITEDFHNCFLLQAGLSGDSKTQEAWEPNADGEMTFGEWKDNVQSSKTATAWKTFLTEKKLATSEDVAYWKYKNAMWKFLPLRVDGSFIDESHASGKP
eukprot:13510553-Alexandrium_andersonii.AAC.1